MLQVHTFWIFSRRILNYEIKIRYFLVILWQIKKVNILKANISVLYNDLITRKV